MQYRFGTFTNPDPAVAVTLELGFVPDHFILYNYTGYSTNTAISRAEWFRGMADAYALIQTVNASDIPVQTLQTTNGFTPFSDGAEYASTLATITGATKANPCVITATGHGFSTGDIVTISSVVGMVQLNTNRYKIVVIDANSFSLKDLFGNPVDSTAFGTYVSGGQANKISDTSTPPGMVEDTGSAGIILGTAVVGAAADVIYWEAFKETPTGW
jgi:hypothetical protein